jgi:hypothetical protein
VTPETVALSLPPTLLGLALILERGLAVFSQQWKKHKCLGAVLPSAFTRNQGPLHGGSPAIAALEPFAMTPTPALSRSDPRSKRK